MATVAKLMGTKKVRRVPVTDANGRLIGLVSVGDLLNAAAAAPTKEKKQIHAALVEALSDICARPPREEVAPALPASKRARGAEGAAAKSVKPNGKKRAKV